MCSVHAGGLTPQVRNKGRSVNPTHRPNFVLSFESGAEAPHKALTLTSPGWPFAAPGLCWQRSTLAPSHTATAAPAPASGRVQGSSKWKGLQFGNMNSRLTFGFAKPVVGMSYSAPSWWLPFFIPTSPDVLLERSERVFCTIPFKDQMLLQISI